MGRRDDRHRKRSPEKPDDPDPFHVAPQALNRPNPQEIVVLYVRDCTSVKD